MISVQVFFRSSFLLNVPKTDVVNPKNNIKRLSYHEPLRRSFSLASSRREAIKYSDEIKQKYDAFNLNKHINDLII